MKLSVVHKTCRANIKKKRTMAYRLRSIVKPKRKRRSFPLDPRHIFPELSIQEIRVILKESFLRFERWSKFLARYINRHKMEMAEINAQTHSMMVQCLE